VTIQPNASPSSAVTISVPAGAATDFGPTTADPLGTNPSVASNTLSVSYAANLTTSTITRSHASIVADGIATSTITVDLKDINGNALSGRTVVIASSRGSVTAVTPHPSVAGRYTASLSGTVTGTATLSYSVDGVTASSTTSVLLIANPPDLTNGPNGSTITASPTSLPADGVSPSLVIVRITDANGNPISGQTVVVQLVNNVSGGGALGTFGIISDNADGTYFITLKAGTVVGTGTLQFTVGGVLAAKTIQIRLYDKNARAAQSTITANPTSIVADGESTSTITVLMKDANGNDLAASGGSVVLTSSAGTLGVVTDNNDGTYTAVLRSSTTAGTATISGTLNGAAITGTATVAFTAGAADVTRSTITASPTSILADGVTTSIITVQLKDANGNNLTTSGGTVLLFSSAGTLGDVTDSNDGTYTAVLRSSTTAGTATISGTLNGADITGRATVTFTAGPQVTLAGGPHSITNLSEFAVTATFSAPVSGFDDVLADVVIAHGRVIAITGGPSIYSLVVAPSGTGDLSITIPRNAAQDLVSTAANDVSNTLLFSNQISEEIKAGIERFLVWRAHNLISNQPGLTRFLQGQSCGHIIANASGGSSSINGCIFNNKTWADISSASSDKGSYTLASIGLHKLVNPNLLIGGMIQIDNADDLEEHASGRGILVGPYFVARLPENPVYLEGRLLFGRTANEISLAGLPSEEFNTDRWLVQLRASGEYDLAEIKLMPSLDFVSTHDHQSSFRSSLGHNIGDQSVSLMRVSVGVDFRVPVSISRGSLEITGGLAGTYSKTNGASVGETSASRGGKLQLGMHYDTSRGTQWRLNAFSDVQGSSNSSQGLAFTVEKMF
jgi:hypothetical protein